MAGYTTRSVGSAKNYESISYPDFEPSLSSLANYRAKDCASGKCQDAPTPERMSLAATAEHLADLARLNGRLAEQLREVVDPQYWLAVGQQKGCVEQTPAPQPHLCENLDMAIGHLESANAHLEGLLQFVGR